MNYGEERTKFGDLSRDAIRKGEDSFSMTYKENLMHLLESKEQNHDRVIILSDRCCSECSKYDKTVLPIDDAIRTMPVPRKDCTNNLPEEKYPYCICSMYPYVDPPF